MPKLKKPKGNPNDLLKQIDEEIKSGKLTEDEIKAFNELKKIIETAIEEGKFESKEITFKLVLMKICELVSTFAISFLFILVMFGFTFSFLSIHEYLPLMIAGLIIAFSHLITGRIDYLRCMYDKLYLGIKIMLGIIKLFIFALINLLVFKLYDSVIIMIISVMLADILSSSITRRIFR